MGSMRERHLDDAGTREADLFAVLVFLGINLPNTDAKSVI